MEGERARGGEWIDGEEENDVRDEERDRDGRWLIVLGLWVEWMGSQQGARGTQETGPRLVRPGSRLRRVPHSSSRKRKACPICL
jgi:hypothetical protein